MTRDEVLGAKRIVVKVGSSSVSGANVGQIEPLVDALVESYQRGVEVVLVSSGAIASALGVLRLDGRPQDLATQQAAAAVGQNVLMWRYQTSLDRYGILAGQVLLTAGDLENPTHRSNAQRAMERLLDLRILPIVNENDTVATQEIRFGDNDRLAALVAELIGADLLVLLSDIDALYTRPPSEPGRSPDLARALRRRPVGRRTRRHRRGRSRHRGSGHQDRRRQTRCRCRHPRTAHLDRERLPRSRRWRHRYLVRRSAQWPNRWLRSASTHGILGLISRHQRNRNGRGQRQQRERH